MEDTVEKLVVFKDENEFEEFDREEWSRVDEDPQDMNVWDDQWDQADIEDDFTDTLRKQLLALGHSF